MEDTFENIYRKIPSTEGTLWRQVTLWGYSNHSCGAVSSDINLEAKMKKFYLIFHWITTWVQIILLSDLVHSVSADHSSTEAGKETEPISGYPCV